MAFRVNAAGASTTPADGSITAAKLASDAVTKAKIADAAVGSNEIDSSEAAAIRTAIGAPADATVTVDGMAGTGWTQVQSSPNSTASWASSKLTVSIAASYVSGSGHPGAERTYTTEDDYDVLARYDLITGDGDAKIALALWAGVSTNNGVLVQVYADGQVNAGYVASSSWTEAQARTSGASSGQLAGGQLWLRHSVRGAQVRSYWGVGVGGAVPTSWTLVAAYTLPSAAARTIRGGWMRVAANTESGVGSTGAVVDVLAIRRSVQPSVTL